MDSARSGRPDSKERDVEPVPRSGPPVGSGASRHWAQGLAILLLLGLVLVLGRGLAEHIPRFASWVDSLGLWAPAVYALGYAVATVAFVPGSVLTLAAGAIFGLGKGFATVFAGATAGAALAFLISRRFARARLRHLVERRFDFDAIDRAVADQGFRVVFLLRLSPAFPFNLLNYALGLTGVRFLDYLLASIGMLPATFLYVYYGKALGSVAAVAAGAGPERGALDWALLALGLAATIAVTVTITRIARRALAREVAT